jgi:hypothetical protein
LVGKTGRCSLHSLLKAKANLTRQFGIIHLTNAVPFRLIVCRKSIKPVSHHVEAFLTLLLLCRDQCMKLRFARHCHTNANGWPCARAVDNTTKMQKKADARCRSEKCERTGKSMLTSDKKDKARRRCLLHTSVSLHKKSILSQLFAKIFNCPYSFLHSLYEIHKTNCTVIFFRQIAIKAVALSVIPTFYIVDIGSGYLRL